MVDIVIRNMRAKEVRQGGNCGNYCGNCCILYGNRGNQEERDNIYIYNLSSLTVSTVSTYFLMVSSPVSIVSIKWYNYGSSFFCTFAGTFKYFKVTVSL